MKAVQIGGGLVGQLIVADMMKDFEVTVVDLDRNTLEEIEKKHPGVRTAVASATDASRLAPILEDADIVTAGVPGRFGYEMMKTVIGLGKNLVDISFMAEDFEELDGLAREKGVTVIPDMGVAPGMSNFLMGRGSALLDEVEGAYIYVGGIPTKAVPPFNYQVTWSPKDCIEEFTRPVTIVRDFRKEVVEATSGLHLREFPGVGTLEGFYTDGLRSLAKNIKARNLGEMTLRWPGHVEQMRLLRSMGLFEETPRNLGGREVVPLDVAADLLFPMWKM
ncbi:MAG TPA: saccharopine dehydrogenase C-terminal domain-containing protein, partial [Synergistales bacterium]|nr:saccharopine dehydrogenase C-terminal domain-containing protein [Synergistales bacterium]